MKTMREMSAEMMKLGIIEEMIEETLESVEPADLEEKAAVSFKFPKKEKDQVFTITKNFILFLYLFKSAQVERENVSTDQYATF